MMATTASTIGVFLSYAVRNSQLAETVRRDLADSGLEVFDPHEIGAQTAATADDTLRAELAESDAVIVVIAQGDTLPSSVLFYVGAASAWHKPIFVVTDRPGALNLPSFFKADAVFPLARLDELANRLKRIAEPLSAEEMAALIAAYEEFGVSVDQMVGDPAQLHAFSTAFNRRVKRHQSDAKIIQSLLRLRKRGALAKVRR